MKKILKLALVAIAPILMSSSVLGSSVPIAPVSSTTSALPNEGTFQIIWTSVKDRNYFTSELDAFIDDHRHQTDVTYHQLTENTYIMILPHDQINDPAFVPLEEVYVYDEDFRL